MSMLFDACVAIDKGGCGGTGCGCGGLVWERSIHQMISICAKETTLGHVMMWVLFIVLIRVVFHGPHGRGLNMKPSFTRGKLPLTAPVAPVTLYYGPATWAKDRSWCYCTPIYMLNHIISLQAVVKIITNETTRALNLLTIQSTKMHNVICQNCLALDYLLASEELVENLT
jgi:hypothetical protein